MLQPPLAEIAGQSILRLSSSSLPSSCFLDVCCLTSSSSPPATLKVTHALAAVFGELVRNCPFDGTNYTVWKRKIMFLLTAENIDYVAITDEPNQPAEDAEDEDRESYLTELNVWTKDNKRARIFILGSMTDSLASEYEGEEVACIIMRRLEEDFGEVSLIKVLGLVNKLLTARMTDNNSVSDYLNKFCALNEELKSAGYPFGEEVQVMLVLNSLPSSWEQFKVSFCHSERTLNMRTLRHHLVMEEDRKRSQGKEKSSHHHELHLGEERRNGNKRNSGKDMRDKINRKRNWDDHAGKSKYDKSNYRCHGCGESGHFRADCPKRKKYNKQKQNYRKPHHDKHQDQKKDNSSLDAAGFY